MSARAKKWIERIKSVLIVLLMLSMTVLFLLTWSTDTASLPEGVQRVVSGVSRFFGGGAEQPPVVEGSRAETYGDAVYLTSAAINSGGRTRAMFAPDASLDEFASSLRPLLADCLASADSPTEISISGCVAATRADGVFAAYSGTLKCSLLARTIGVECHSAGDSSADRVFLAAADGKVELYAISGGGCYRFTTAVDSARLDALLSTELGGAADWSYDLGFADADLAVYPDGDLRVPTASSSPATVSDGTFGSMLEAFSMNPATNYRYTSAGGTQYVVEDAQLIAISVDGHIRYAFQGGTASGYHARAMRSEDAAVEHCRKLLGTVAAGAIGDAKLSLRAVEYASDGKMTVRFGYTLGSLPVYIDGSRDAAVFTFESGTLTSAHITLRRYAYDGETALMMPPASAAAIGSGALCYFDSTDTGTLTPDWTR